LPSLWFSYSSGIHHDDVDALQRDALRLARMPLEAEAFDLRWDGGRGSLLVRFAGSAAAERAAKVAGEVIEDDEDVWAQQRARQRGDFVVRVHALPTEIARVLRAVPGATAVGRAGVGTIWLQVPSDFDVTQLRGAITPLTCVVLDAPPSSRGTDPFSLKARPERALMQSLKDRFDPENRCNPGLLL